MTEGCAFMWRAAYGDPADHSVTVMHFANYADALRVAITWAESGLHAWVRNPDGEVMFDDDPVFGRWGPV